MSSPDTPIESTKPRIQFVNIANVLAYAANTFTTYFVGISGRFPTNAELSEKYQTIVTPAGYAFSIWGVIFVSQFIWVVAQLFPAYRSAPLVIKGVGYFYVITCLAQITWSIVFAAELIPVSLAAMLSILIALLVIVFKSSAIDAEGFVGYFLLKFPFHIHAGWILAASLVNTNVVLVAQELSSDVQVYAGYGSLVTLILVGLMLIYKQLWVLPCVLSWASFAIAVELDSPNDKIVETFSATTINTIKMASGSVAIAILVATVFYAVYARLFLQKPSSESNERTTTNYAAM